MSGAEFKSTRNDGDRIDRRAELARTLARGGMEGAHIISIETAQKVLSPKRLEILRFLRQEEVGSVSELAEKLDRDKSQVSRDLSDLAEQGVIEFETDGRSKIPRLAQEHLVIEPVA